jgi:hypothetical protein
MQVTTYENKIFFSGGHTVSQNNWNLFSTVDIYDVITNSWSTAQLSERRMDLAACLVENRILFGGGLGGPGDQPPTHVSTKVDVYDLANNTWTTSSLSQSRALLSGVTGGSKIYFAGGNTMHTIYTGSCNPTSRVDIYDKGLNSRSTLELNTLRSNMAAISVSGKIYWAGGEVVNCGSSYSLSNEVQIFDPNTQRSTYSCLFQPNARFKAVIKGDNIIFFIGQGSVKDRFDIYNVTTGKWSIGLLQQRVYESDIYSYGDVVYLSNGSTAWKLEF